MSLAFEMNENGLFKKVMTYKLCLNANFKNWGTTIQMGILHVLYKLCQNVNFKNWGTTIQMGILHVLLNILPISFLSMVNDMYGYFGCEKCSHVIFHFEEN